MWRTLPIVALLGLAGCATPPALRIASFALDGISYLASGKSVSDHALSIVTQQDCAMWRLIQKGDPMAVCRDAEDVLVADAAGDPAQDTGPSESGEVHVASLSNSPRTRRRGPPDRAPAVRRPPVFGPVAKAPPAAPESALAAYEFESGAAFARDFGDADLTEFGPPASAEAALAVDDFKAGAMIARGGVGPAAFGPPARAQTLLAIDDFKAATLLSRDRRDAEPVVVGPPAPANLALAAGNFKSTYLVVGSYRVSENASRVADRLTVGFSEAPTAVASAVIDNRVFRRVLVGPIVADDVAAARARLRDIGLGGSWKITLCSADLNPPPCAAPTSDPKL